MAKFLNSEVKVQSNMTRIQDFYREVEIDYDFVAILLLALLPKNKKLRICIDRTDSSTTDVILGRLKLTF